MVGCWMVGGGGGQDVCGWGKRLVEMVDGGDREMVWGVEDGWLPPDFTPWK
jgi:hypothetical protein